MQKTLSDILFSFEREGTPSPALERCSARDLGLKEAWFRDAIFANPELVIGACRAAGVTDDDWYPWAREYFTEVGPVDVLLLSSQGRVAIVETKLSTNPELRRRVLAQALDYLTHLPDALETSMPEIPKEKSGDPIADVEDIRESVAQGDILVIIVSDDADPRVTKLSRNLIGDNLVKEWDLVLVDLALFRTMGTSTRRITVVPHVRSLVLSELRQVVRVVVPDVGGARVQVEHIAPEPVGSERRKWDERQFFESLTVPGVPVEVQTLATKLRELATKHPDSVELVWGSGRRHGSMVLKRKSYGLIQIHGSGAIRFRPTKFVGALGKEVAHDYLQALKKLAPGAMKMGFPLLNGHEAAQIAGQLYGLINGILADPRLKS
jgi:hypothetical protein